MAQEPTGPFVEDDEFQAWNLGQAAEDHGFGVLPFVAASPPVPRSQRGRWTVPDRTVLPGKLALSCN